jgi:hypothetical protein
MRFRDDNPAELARARAAVAGWHDQNPAGNAEELIAAIGHRFHRDFEAVPPRGAVRGRPPPGAPGYRGGLSGADVMSAFRARLTGLALEIVPDEPDQVLRLSRFREKHPGVIIGDGGFGTWQPVSPNRTARRSSPGTPSASCSTNSMS